MIKIDKTNLSDQTKFRLDEIRNIEKYVFAFDYIDNNFNVLNSTTGWVCIISHATAVGVPVGIASAGFTIALSLATGIVKKNIKSNKKQKEKTW